MELAWWSGGGTGRRHEDPEGQVIDWDSLVFQLSPTDIEDYEPSETHAPAQQKERLINDAVSRCQDLLSRLAAHKQAPKAAIVVSQREPSAVHMEMARPREMEKTESYASTPDVVNLNAENKKDGARHSSMLEVSTKGRRQNNSEEICERKEGKIEPTSQKPLAKNASNDSDEEVAKRKKKKKKVKVKKKRKKHAKDEKRDDEEKDSHKVADTRSDVGSSNEGDRKKKKRRRRHKDDEDDDVKTEISVTEISDQEVDKENKREKGAKLKKIKDKKRKQEKADKVSSEDVRTKAEKTKVDGEESGKKTKRKKSNKETADEGPDKQKRKKNQKTEPGVEGERHDRKSREDSPILEIASDDPGRAQKKDRPIKKAVPGSTPQSLPTPIPVPSPVASASLATPVAKIAKEVRSRPMASPMRAPPPALPASSSSASGPGSGPVRSAGVIVVPSPSTVLPRPAVESATIVSGAQVGISGTAAASRRAPWGPLCRRGPQCYWLSWGVCQYYHPPEHSAASLEYTAPPSTSRRSEYPATSSSSTGRRWNVWVNKSNAEGGSSPNSLSTPRSRSRSLPKAVAIVG